MVCRPALVSPRLQAQDWLPCPVRLVSHCGVCWEGLEVQSPCSMAQTLTPWGRALPHFLSPALPFLELFRYRNFLLSSHLGPGHSLSPPCLDAQASRYCMAPSLLYGEQR